MDGDLKFEGEYLYGKRWKGKYYDGLNNIVSELVNGKGLIKEFDKNDILSSEGNYVNGEKNGAIKDYNYYNSKLEFEGEYLNGKRNGKGKAYDNYGELKFEGEYLYDYRIRGRGYINNRLEYEGEYLYEKKWNGKGYDKKGNVIYV